MDPARNDNAPSKSCPYCGESILAVAIKCKHCGSDLATSGAAPRKSSFPAAIAGFVSTLLIAIFLAATNPTQADFRELIRAKVSQKLADKAASDGPSREPDSPILTGLATAAATAALSGMTDRTSYLFFSVFEVDASLLRSLGEKQLHNRKFLGVAGQIIPLSFGSSEGQGPFTPASPSGDDDAAFEAKTCSEPLGSKAESASFRGEYGTFRTLSAKNDSLPEEIACLGETPIHFDGAQYVSLEKAFSVDSFRLLGMSFGHRDIYLVDTKTGGTIDGSITDSCAFITVFGKSKFKVLGSVECPVRSDKGPSDLTGFTVDGQAIRYQVHNPAGYSDKDDFGTFELRDGAIQTLSPFRGDDYYRKKFSALTPLAIMKEAFDDGRWGQGDPEISLSCGGCSGYREKYCFKLHSVPKDPHPSDPQQAIARRILETSCKGE